MTVLENIEAPLKGASIPIATRRKAAEELAIAFGLGHRLRFLPSELSGGECQRVAMARAVVNRPRMLLADEPTGSLDTRTGRLAIAELLKACSQIGSIVFLATHNPDVAAQADRTLYLRDGQVEAKKSTLADLEAYNPSNNPSPLG